MPSLTNNAGARVMTIGMSLTGARDGSLFDNTNLGEFNTIFWRPDALKQLQHYPSDTWARLNRRLSEIDRWVETGNTLFVLVQNTHGLLLNYRPNQQSGYLKQSLWSLPPLKGIALRVSVGQLVEACGSEEARELLQPIAHYFRYDAIMEGQGLFPLFRVSLHGTGSSQIVGGFKRHGKGYIVFLPEAPMGYDRIASELLDITSKLGATAPEIPAWTFGFALPEEATARDAITELQNSISNLQSQISTHQSHVDAVQEIKQLIWGTGTPFVTATVAALRALDLNVVEGPHPRADILAFDGLRIAVIEAKGLEGCVKETNLRQAEAWVTDVQRAIAYSPEERAADADMNRYAVLLEGLGAMDRLESDTPLCKGIMVIGTHRKVPLDVRTAEDSPDPVARVVNRSKICALSGLQLLTLTIKARNSQEQKKQLVDTLFSTDGVSLLGKDWADIPCRAKLALWRSKRCPTSMQRCDHRRQSKQNLSQVHSHT